MVYFIQTQEKTKTFTFCTLKKDELNKFPFSSILVAHLDSLQTSKEARESNSKSKMDYNVTRIQENTKILN